MIFRPKHFKAHELVGQSIYDRFGEDSYRYLRRDLLLGLDTLWEILNVIKPTTITVNNWKTGGQYKESGLRVAGDSTYKPGSAHSVGAAADLKFSTWTIPGALDKVLHDPALKMFTRYENPASTPTWLHLDTLSTDMPEIQMVNP